MSGRHIPLVPIRRVGPKIGLKGQTAEAEKPVLRKAQPEAEKQNTEELPSAPEHPLDAQATGQLMVKRLSSSELKIPPEGMPPLPLAPLTGLSPKPSPRMRLPSVPAPRTPPLILAHETLDLAVLSQEPITVQKVLKGNKDKLTFLVDVGGESYVVKGGAGYADLDDHLTNSDVFNRLQMPGVKAPVAKKLTDSFRTAVEAKLTEGDPGDQLISQVLDANNDVISTKAPGVGVDSVFDSAKRAQMETLLHKIKGATDSRMAIQALRAQLEGGLLPMEKFMIKQKGGNLLDDLEDPAVGSKAILSLGDGNTLTAPKSLLTLSWIAELSTKAPLEVQKKLESQIQDLDLAQFAFASHVKTKDGASAIGSLGMVDLLCGMDDRIVGDKFNGGNFMFDRQTNDLWCIDNAKKATLALSSADDGKWKEWVVQSTTLGNLGGTDKGKTIGEFLHWAVYDRKSEDEREPSQNVILSPVDRATTRAGVEDAVPSTLDTMQALVGDPNNGLPAQIRQKLTARLEFVRARKKFLDLLPFDDQFKVPPSAENPSAGNKAFRAIAGKIAGWTDVQKTAEKLKETARDPHTSTRDLQANDKDLSDYLTQNPKADQRVLKALFATRSELFVRTIKTKTQSLKDLAAKNKAWGDLAPALIDDNIRNITNQWIAKLKELGDKDGADELSTAVGEYVRQLNPTQA